MKAIIMVMLAVQVGVLLATAGAIVMARPTRERQRPVWSSFTISLVVIASASWNIAESHTGEPGADLLAWGAPFLLGMAITCALMLIRQRRGLDAQL
jgi:hypothetical protein